MERHGKMTNTRKVLLTLAAFCLIVFLTGRIAFAIKEYQTESEAEKRQELYAHILDAAATHPTELTTTFTHPTSQGSPLVFGGSHTPPLEHEDAWKQIADIGVTSVRKDLYVEFSLPRNTTVEQYVQNKNGIQNTDNWDQKTISTTKAALKNIKSRGMKVIGIMAYSPAWLSYNNSPFGVPRDWVIYKDIVKKIYMLYRDDLDYIEIWNEPDHKSFLVTENSGYSREDAYINIYNNASNAIREVDNEKNDGKTIPLIGPVESNPRVSSLLKALLSSSKINYKPNFFSFHTYDEYLPSLEIYKNTEKELLNKSTPILITEWNSDSPFMDMSQYKTGDKALVFTANRLLEYIKSGVQGANYFSLLPINTNNRNTDEKTMGFYRWIDNRAELLPQAKSWRILSRDLSLGKGKSDIFTPVTEDQDINALGFTNIDNDQGLALVNPTSESKMIAMHFDKLPIQNFAKVQVFYASAGNDAKTPVYEGTLRVQNGQTKFNFIVPKESVMGVKLSQEKDWFNVFGFK